MKLSFQPSDGHFTRRGEDPEWTDWSDVDKPRDAKDRGSTRAGKNPEGFFQRASRRSLAPPIPWAQI